MDILLLFLIIAGAIIGVWIAWGIISPHIWEKPDYELKEKEEKFEIRRYKDAKILSTITSGSNSGFSTLASYIFGKNKEKAKVAMTSPVLTEMMDNKNMKTVFFVPKKFENKEMPTPLSDDIQISTQKERDVAIIRFYGLMSEKKREKYIDRLLNILQKKDIQIKGSAFYMGYSDPFVPPPLRRNEIGIELSVD
jgi:hypothetical protein